MKTIKLNAVARKETGKGFSRRLRDEGLVPAIFYGFEAKPMMITVNSSDLIKVIEQERSETVFVKLTINDGGKKIQRVSIIKDLQIDTIKRKLIHADFYGIKMDRELTIDLPIILTGQPVGVEMGGELQQLKREVKISGLPSVLPESVEIDISNLEVGDSIKVGDIALDEGIKCIDSEDIAIAAVATKRVSVLAEAEIEEEAAEEGKEEPAEEAAASDSVPEGETE
jgi:large subunit ribosomal protein L25